MAARSLTGHWSHTATVPDPVESPGRKPRCENFIPLITIQYTYVAVHIICAFSLRFKLSDKHDKCEIFYVPSATSTNKGQQFWMQGCYQTALHIKSFCEVRRMNFGPINRPNEKCSMNYLHVSHCITCIKCMTNKDSEQLPILSCMSSV